MQTPHAQFSTPCVQAQQDGFQPYSFVQRSEIGQWETPFLLPRELLLFTYFFINKLNNAAKIDI